MRELAWQLEAEYGRSYAEKSLRRLRQFADVFVNPAIVATLWRQLRWSHFKLLMAVAEPLRRDFYPQLATLHRWSVRELARQLDGRGSSTSVRSSAGSPGQ